MDDLAVDLKRLGRELESGSSPSFEDLKGQIPSAGTRNAWIVAAAVSLAALAMGGYFLSARFRGSVSLGPEAHRTVLIVPFEVRGQKEGGDYLGLAFAEALAVRLAASQGLTVLPVQVADPKRAAAGRSAVDEARRLQAGRLVTGSITRVGEQLEVDATLVDAERGKVVGGSMKTYPTPDASQVVPAVALELTTQLGVTVPRTYDVPRNRRGSPEMAGSPELAAALAVLLRKDVPAARGATQKLVGRFPTDPAAHWRSTSACLPRRDIPPRSRTSTWRRAG